jgi:DICT domain-containing protein
MNDLAIKEVAEQSGIAAGTLRMWEQRYSFPKPKRSSNGYRSYSAEDVEALRRVQAYRHRGLSIASAIERAIEDGSHSDRPSLYAAVASSSHDVRPQILRKSTLMALSRAIEHETLASAAAPVLIGAFQHESFYRAVEPRYRQLAKQAEAAVVFADFAAERSPKGGPVEIPLAPEDALGNEWAVVVDAPGYCACLLAWEQHGVTEPGADADGDRQFEAIWTLDPLAARRASQAAARLVARTDPTLGAELDQLLLDRPMAINDSAPALTALTNRVVAYLEAA